MRPDKKKKGRMTSEGNRPDGDEPTPLAGCPTCESSGLAETIDSSGLGNLSVGGSSLGCRVLPCSVGRTPEG